MSVARELLVAARQLSDHPLDRRGRAVDLAGIPDLTLRRSGVRRGMGLYRQVEVWVTTAPLLRHS
jgi:hypothetical protein